MAEEEKKEETPAEGGKKSNKMMIIIIAVLVVLLIAGGVGAFFALKDSKKTAGAADDEETVDEEQISDSEAGGLPGAVVPLETFIVNLQVKGSFLKTTIQLEFETPEPPHNLEHEVAKLRDGVIRILSSKAASDILSAEGKEKLRNEIKDALNEILGSEEIYQIYFTEFIVQ